jgi:hypothetical protein
MNTLNLLIVTLLVSHIWYDVIEMQFIIKRLFKMPLHKARKPFDCYTCTNFWIGVIGIIIMTFFYDVTYFNISKFIIINYLIGHYIDHIKNK